MSEYQPPDWHDPAGRPLGCREKLRVLNENIDELRGVAQDALEDAVIIGCDERQVRQALHRLIDALENPYRQES